MSKKDIPNKVRKQIAQKAKGSQKKQTPNFFAPANPTIPSAEELEKLHNVSSKLGGEGAPAPDASKPVDRRQINASGLSQFVQRNPTMQHKLNQSIKTPEEFTEALKKLSRPYVPDAAAQQAATESTATYENLKRRRSPQYMGTDPNENKAILENLLLKRQVQEAVVNHPEFVQAIQGNEDINPADAHYLTKLVATTKSLQQDGAVLLTPETARQYGVAVDPHNIVPGTHIVLDGSPVAEHIAAMGRERQEAYEEQMARRPRLPVKWLVSGVAVMMGSYALAIIWEVHVELNDEPPKWAQALAQRVFGHPMPAEEDDDDEEL
jgi:hypothetical protein